MMFNPNEDEKESKLTLNNEIKETVDDFKYLGARMVSSETDFRIRKGQTWRAF